MSVPHQVFPFYAGEALQPGDLNLAAQAFVSPNRTYGWGPVVLSSYSYMYVHDVRTIGGSAARFIGPMGMLGTSQLAPFATQDSWIPARLGPTMKMMKVSAPFGE